VRGQPQYEEWKKCFELDGFKDIIIADHMWEFAEKYGMDIVGKLNPGVDTLTFCPCQAFLSPKPWDHSIMVVTKGAHVWYDGHDYLIPAINSLASKYPDLEVTWLGYPPPKMSCKVTHVRTYNEDEVARLYSRATVFVSPSLIEGTPRTVREAMACGTPVVATPIGLDYAEHGENIWLVPMKDAQAIVEGVSTLFEDECLRERIMLNGLRPWRERTHLAYVKHFYSILGGLLA